MYNAKYGHAIDGRLSGLTNTIITYAFVCILGYLHVLTLFIYLDCFMKSYLIA